ncbi:stimulus-sensing domain-containing protein [Alteriqipengyuania lutimaris]|uniref:stimulus-sensing domain-containing protein n=1 Tax=Alteriqipengyuania lutimaris TaxID=1538146 RepID=UPI00180160AC|nr:stimulus-sensing domain-containing protein [Alteriqipengyuania lutimaris]MBB3033322.1 two-component system sensor histidine kinase ChvG [Alteriqipengyuania lutimaris]
MAEPGGGVRRIARPLERVGGLSRLSLTARILAVNILPLALLGGGIVYLDSYRAQLLDERYKLARIEAQITAEALAGATRERQDALLLQIAKEQDMRLRLFDPEGQLMADSFELGEPTFTLDDPSDDPFGLRFARFLDQIVDTMVSAQPVPRYIEPESNEADAWPELQRARELGISQIELRQAADRTPVITAAAPVGLQGATLLTTRNAIDITESVRNARSTLGTGVFFALVASILLSLFLARTIVTPLQTLSKAAQRVRLGREREVQVPRLPDRRDEIGMLARAIADMTDALRHRIDAVEHFAADVAHEIKNPLASLRSATESLGSVDDPELRAQLLEIARHDVRRIDRLVTEISDASRIDAELSRATFARVDLTALVGNIIERRGNRGLDAGCEIVFAHTGGEARVMGVPERLERVVDNLLDNAASFSSEGGVIDVVIERDRDALILMVMDEGPGIPPEARTKVFERFHSDRPEEESFGNHSGLGLAIARTIAEAHGGTLSAQDRPDGARGACMVLALPAIVEDETSVA